MNTWKWPDVKDKERDAAGGEDGPRMIRRSGKGMVRQAKEAGVQTRTAHKVCSAAPGWQPGSAAGR